jgi:hypothetical protein
MSLAQDFHLAEFSAFHSLDFLCECHFVASATESHRKATVNHRPGLLPYRSQSRIIKRRFNMRGLDARIELAHARTLAIADGIVLGFQGGRFTNIRYENAIFMAVEDGAHDFRSGIADVPLLFSGESDLIASWEFGRQSAAEQFEGRNCRRCNHPDGNPCEVHGF